jgi:hypothetical protein
MFYVPQVYDTCDCGVPIQKQPTQFVKVEIYIVAHALTVSKADIQAEV